MELEIVTLVVSPLHRYDGRPADGPRPHDDVETAASVRIRAHKGVVGDRYFGTRFTFAAVTFLAEESISDLARDLGGGPFDPVLARRNVVTRGHDIDALARTTFTLEAGHGPIRFRSLTPANPCAWMNEVFAPGAHQALRGHAGIRCEPLDDGELRVGPATVTDIAPIPPEEMRRRVSSAPVS